MKYMVFTTKHHDGFCMFDSRLTDYKITNSPFKRDVVKELADACHKAGLKLGYYYSPPGLAPPRLSHREPPAVHRVHARPAARDLQQLRPDRHHLVRRPRRHGQGLGRGEPLQDDPPVAAARDHQQPRRSARRLRHAGAADRQVPERPALGDLHDHLPAVGLEAERPDEVAQGVPPDARPRRRRRRQPPVQRRPDARRPHRAAAGRAAQGNGRLAPPVRREHLRHPRRPVQDHRPACLHVQRQHDLRAHPRLAERHHHPARPAETCDSSRPF